MTLMSMPQLTAMVLSSSLWTSSALALDLLERSDIKQGMTQLVCQSATLPSAIPLDLWAQGIADAQLEGSLTTESADPSLSDAELARKARAQARIHHYQAYAYGRCPDGRAWTVALPSPTPLGKQGDDLLLPVAVLHDSCASWRADFVKNSGGDAELLHVRGGKIATQQLGDGVISISCQPHSPSWQGPVEWFLTAVGKAPTREVPAAQLLSENKNQDDLLAWINQLRIKQNLQPILLNEELNKQAETLTLDSSLAHNRQYLRKISSKLSERNINLLGENRVKGRTLAEMAWLLWYSPRHRALLLSPEANTVGLSFKHLKDNDLAVMIFADSPAQRLGRSTRIDPNSTKLH